MQRYEVSAYIIKHAVGTLDKIRSMMIFIALKTFHALERANWVKQSKKVLSRVFFIPRMVSSVGKKWLQCLRFFIGALD